MLTEPALACVFGVPAALYGWPEAVEALLEDEAVVRTADGLQQPLRETLLADSQGHHRCVTQHCMQRLWSVELGF